MKYFYLILVFLFVLISFAFSCSKSRNVSGIESSKILLNVKAYDLQGNISQELTECITPVVLKNADEYNVSVNVSGAIKWHYAFVKLEFPVVLQPVDYQSGGFLPNSYNGGFCTAPGNYDIVSIIPGSNPNKYDGNGVLCSFTLSPNDLYEAKRDTNFALLDPVVQNLETTNDGSHNYIEWVEVLRGDANLNHTVDFADFGVIGAEFNTKVSVDKEPADPNDNGIVDFADFGVIGANYNRKIVGFTLLKPDGIMLSVPLKESAELVMYRSIRGWWGYKLKTDNEPDNYQVLPGTNNSSVPSYVTAQIGESGGSLSNGDFSLQVPAGAFDGDYQISIRKSKSSAGFNSYLASGVYTVEGIPDSILKDINVSIISTGVNNSYVGNSYLVMQEDNVPTSNTLLSANQILESSKSGSLVTAIIPPSDELALKTNASLRQTSEVTTTRTFWAITGYYAYLSSSQKFRIVYPAYDLIEGGAEKIAAKLEEAYSKIESIGFSWDRRKRWPMTINITPMQAQSVDSDRWGELNPSILGVNYYSINLNANNILSQDGIDKTAIAAAHELFHFAQTLYDPRNRVAKTYSQDPWLWLNEATATWFESQVSSNKNYISTEAVANSLFLYTNGLLTPTGATQQDIQNHGYGASILVKWLTSKYGNEYVYNLYKKRTDLPNTSLIDILKSLSSVTFENDWMLFCQDYIAGKVYPNSVLDISLRGSAPSKKYIWEYDGIKDKYSYWKALELNGSLTHLSARTYRINCNETFEPSAMLEIAFVNYDGIDNKCKTYLYKYSSGNLSYIAEAKIVGKEAGYPGSYVYSVLLTKVETKIKKGDSLILLVSNANNGNSPATTVPNANKISTFGLIRLKPDKIKAMVADVYGQIHKSPDNTDIPKLLSLGGSFTLGHNPDPWEFDIAWTGDTTFDIDIDYTTPFKTSYRIKGEFSSDFSSLVSIDYSHYNDFGVSPMRKETDWQFVCNNVGRYYQYINDASYLHFVATGQDVSKIMKSIRYSYYEGWEWPNAFKEEFVNPTYTDSTVFNMVIYNSKQVADMQ